jgi:hydroxymethylpyrimidine/phosphomethylpyrimidine kinase
LYAHLDGGHSLFQGEVVMKNLLTIAGSDCSGGAGIQADLKTFAAHGAYGMSVIVSVVAENTSRVVSIQDMPPKMIADQIDAVFEDIKVDGVKIGMLSGAEQMKIVAEKLRYYRPHGIVLDPVMAATGGHALMHPDALETLKKELLPLAFVLTPNIPEAEAITGIKIQTVEDRKAAAVCLQQMGSQHVLIKGGHLTGDAEDILYDGKAFYLFKTERINTKNTHGTGCTLSSAIAANLANGMNVPNAVQAAKDYITTAIRHALPIGKGHGPTNHFYTLYKNGGLLK